MCVVGAGMLLAGFALMPKPAFAQYMVRLPYVIYAGLSEEDEDRGECPPWGNGAYYYYKIEEQGDEEGEDNVVWNEGNVFDDTEREVSKWDNNMYWDWSVAVHNPTGQDYTSGLDRVWITVFDTDGNQLDESDDDINTSPSATGLSWIGTPPFDLNMFMLNVPSGQTRTFQLSDIFNKADPYEQHTRHFTLRLHCPVNTGRNGFFVASMNGYGNSRYRWLTGGQGVDYFCEDEYSYTYRWGYNAPAEKLFDGLTEPCLVLPYWKDTTDDGGWTTMVWFVNTDDSAADITVYVYELDGTLINDYTFEDVEPNERRCFIPSQFLEEQDPREGYLEITNYREGTPDPAVYPLATAHLIHMPTVDWPDPWYYEGRYWQGQIVEFIVEDND